MPRVAVLNFIIRENVIHMGKGFEDIWWNDDRTKTLTSIFASVLSNTKKFDVMEREKLKDINAERVFTEITTGNISSREGFGGAQYCIIGEVKNLSCNTNETQIPYSTFIKKEFSGEIDLIIRMVSVSSGKYIVSRDVNVRKTVSSISSPEAFLNDIIKECAEKAINSIIDGAYPPKVASVDSTNIYINRGVDGGFKVGSRLMVYSPGKDIIDPDTKVKIGQEEVPVGEIEIVEIQSKMSKAIPVSSSITEFKEGMICRITQLEPVVPPKPLTPGSSSQPIRWD